MSTDAPTVVIPAVPEPGADTGRHRAAGTDGSADAGGLAPPELRGAVEIDDVVVEKIAATALGARGRARATMAAVTALPPELRAPLVLHEIEQLSYQEVAAILNLSEPTVRGRLHRGRRRLADAMREWA